MTMILGPAHWDDELSALSRLLNRGGWQAHEVAQIQRAAQDRAEFVRSGILHPTALYWTHKIQSEIDERTRMRYDFKSGWVLDRWAEGRWQVVGVLGFNNIDPWLINYLRERDMQRWPSPQAYLAHKRALAEKKRCDNWAKGVEQINGIVDGMGSKRIKEFIQTERAMQTGETIIMHGPTKRMFDRMKVASAKSPAIPHGRSINPGMHPFKYKRRTGGKHIKEV